MYFYFSSLTAVYMGLVYCYWSKSYYSCEFPFKLLVRNRSFPQIPVPFRLTTILDLSFLKPIVRLFLSRKKILKYFWFMDSSSLHDPMLYFMFADLALLFRKEQFRLLICFVLQIQFQIFYQIFLIVSLIHENSKPQHYLASFVSPKAVNFLEKFTQFKGRWQPRLRKVLQLTTPLAI